MISLLLAADDQAIKRIRDEQPEFAQITRDLILKHVDVDVTLATQLCFKFRTPRQFRYWTEPQRVRDSV
jgi:hypothetical protein